MDMEHSHGKMELNILETGGMIKWMDKVSIKAQMEISILGYGKKEKLRNGIIFEIIIIF